MATIRYVVTGGYFHNNRDRSEHRSPGAAEKARKAHARECTCGGVAIEARGPKSALVAAGAYETETSGMVLRMPSGDFLRAVPMA